MKLGGWMGLYTVCRSRRGSGEKENDSAVSCEKSLRILFRLEKIHTYGGRYVNIKELVVELGSYRVTGKV